MSEQHISVGLIKVKAGDQTDPKYSFEFRPEARCVVTELYSEWSVFTSDEDIKAFLHSGQKLGLPPTPNYRIFHGLKAGSFCPLMNLFDLKDHRKRFTHEAFDPIPPNGIPLGSTDDSFEIVLDGTPITVNSAFELKFSIKTRPFNS